MLARRERNEAENQEEKAEMTRPEQSKAPLPRQRRDKDVAEQYRQGAAMEGLQSESHNLGYSPMSLAPQPMAAGAAAEKPAGPTAGGTGEPSGQPDQDRQPGYNPMPLKPAGPGFPLAPPSA